MKHYVFTLIALLILTFMLCSCKNDENDLVDTDTVITSGTPATETEKDNSNMNIPDLSSSTAVSSVYGGVVGERIKANYDNWLYRVIDDNPYMLDAIRLRNTSDKKDIVTWFGEFPGALLWGMASCYKLEQDEKLGKIISDFVYELSELQDKDGYLGPFADSQKLSPELWDIGGHFFMMTGLIEWYEATLYDENYRQSGEHALDMCKKIAELIYEYRVEQNKSISAGQLMILYPIAKLYGITDDYKLKILIRNIDDYMFDTGVSFSEGALSGKEYYELPVHRWENAFDVMALGELYLVTGNEKYKTAFTTLWESILKTDRHPTGCFSTAETTHGTVYINGSLETCAALAWESLTSLYYRITLDSYAIDELELTTLNAMLGAQLPDGSQWTYDTPRAGTRISSKNELSWQATSGTPDMNCCSANGARGLGTLNEWSLYRKDNTVYVNYYGESEFIIGTPSGNALTVTQITDYPSSGDISLKLALKIPERFTLALRIPFWVNGASVMVNGEIIENAVPGEYLSLEREWADGDNIEISLEMALHCWKMSDVYTGRVCLYYGPILFAADEAHNPGVNVNGINITPDSLSFTLSEADSEQLKAEITSSDGKKIILCDFASAGADGGKYSSFLYTSLTEGWEVGDGGISWNSKLAD